MQKRAWLLRAGLAVAVLAAWRWAPAQQPAAGGYVLGPEEGEVLRRPNGQVIVKVDPRRGGSKGMALGTQDLIVGAGIGVHRHDGADEVLRIEQGHGKAVLGDRRVEVGPGTTVFVPRGTWHGVENTGEALRLVWVVTPPGLENFFRAIGAAPGEPLKQLTPAQMAEIGRQHGTTFRGP